MLAAIVIFLFMGNFSYLANIPINKIPLSGPDLTFIIYPTSLTMMPFANFWCFLFFAIMILLGIDTQFGQLDCASAALEDELENRNFIAFGYKVSMPFVRFLICLGISLFGFLFCS